MAISPSIPASNRVPGIYLRLLLGVGLRAAADIARSILLVGNKTSAGSAVVGTRYSVTSEDEARSLFGAGSELFLMVKAAIAAAKSVTLYAIAVTESAGTAASATLTVTGTATSAGTIRVWVAGEYVDVAVALNDAQNAIATAINAAIGTMTDWPVTSGVATNVVTATARHKGPRGNRIGWRAEVLEGAAGVTLTLTGSGFLASGATSDDPQAVLDTMLGTRHHYIVSPYDDATNLAKFTSHVDAQDEPEVGQRTQVIAASVDTQANQIALTTGRNFARLQVVGQEGGEQTPAAIAAAMAAVRATEESLDPAANLDGVVVTGIKPSPRLADKLTGGEKIAAVNAGITVLVEVAGGSMAIVRSVTTRTKDANGGADYRVLDTSKVTVADYVCDTIEVGFADRFQGYKLKPDPAEGAPPVPPKVCTPSIARDYVYAELLRLENDEGVLEQVEARKAEVIVEIAAAPAGRLLGSLPVDVIEGLHQFTPEVRQVG